MGGRLGGGLLTTARAGTDPSTRIVLVLCFLQGEQQLAAAAHGAIANPLRRTRKTARAGGLVSSPRALVPSFREKGKSSAALESFPIFIVSPASVPDATPPAKENARRSQIVNCRTPRGLAARPAGRGCFITRGHSPA
jgi:hypothetical protein